MRLLRWSVAALTACFNVTSSDQPPPNVDPPIIACSLPDAGDAGYFYDPCTLPPSVCADSHWVAYFDNGTCGGKTCELVTKYHYCPTGCYGGGCASSGETNPGRGF